MFFFHLGSVVFGLEDEVFYMAIRGPFISNHFWNQLFKIVSSYLNIFVDVHCVYGVCQVTDARIMVLGFRKSLQSNQRGKGWVGESTHSFARLEAADLISFSGQFLFATSWCAFLLTTPGCQFPGSLSFSIPCVFVFVCMSMHSCWASGKTYSLFYFYFLSVIPN